jgi:hypothetical protein
VRIIHISFPRGVQYRGIINRKVVAVVKTKDGRGTGKWEAVRMINEQLGGSVLDSSAEWFPWTQE